MGNAKVDDVQELGTETTVVTEYPPEVANTTSPVVTKYNNYTTVSTLTETLTIESQVPGTKKNYLACADENFMSTANGDHEAHFGTICIPCSSFALRDVQNPYECCVACQNNPKCFCSIFPIDRPSDCYNFVSTNFENVWSNGPIN
ncbi:uncharacterized protein FTOL_06433 [Fusarium torulosum]|uniref:Uncharacterized protein n=1 Tax=Fusarium torulosum TaxID=33205 RepID=A0AAE8M918_9HYPO|nr:uncharacterized protein FTOL_06433 [Fusarium torulosum]